MNKFRLLPIFFLTLFIIVSIFFGCLKTEADTIEKTDIINQNNSDYTQFNDFFTPAFQLIWNDFSDKFIKGKVNFIGGNPKIVDYFNERRLDESMISEKDLYKTMGKQTFSTKKRIEKELKRKFNEKSNLLESLEWFKKTDRIYVLYAMFKKDIFFSKSFEELNSASFNKSENKYKYFGVISNTNKYSKFVAPLYYKNENDYAVKLATKSGDEIILLTSESQAPVLKIWDELFNETVGLSKGLPFDDEAELIIPKINFKKSINYNELLGKKIQGSNFIIGTALEDIDFSLDKDGAKIKNEAIMSVAKMAFRPDKFKKKYNFNKPFVLFIRAKDANVPYFALKIKDTLYLEK